MFGKSFRFTLILKSYGINLKLNTITKIAINSLALISTYSNILTQKKVRSMIVCVLLTVEWVSIGNRQSILHH